MLSGCVRWPEEFERRYREEGYWKPELLGNLLDPWLDAAGGRTALVTDTGFTTYAELHDRTGKLASGFQRLGLGPGDRVVVQLPNSVDFVTVSLALFRLGAIPVFALMAHRRHEILYLCRHSEAVAYIMPKVHLGFDYRPLAADARAEVLTLRHLISTGESDGQAVGLDDLLDPSPARYPEIDAGEVAFFLLSGGTTGAPKLIPRTHQDYAYQLRATAEAVRVDDRFVYLAALPAAHNAALGCPGVLGTLRAGRKVVLATSPSPGDVFPLIAREKVTLTTLMPSVLKLWVEMAELLRADLSGVVFQIGGAYLDPQVAQRVFDKLGARLTHWFGMAEGFLSCTRLGEPAEVSAHTSGRPLCEADEVRVVDENDCDVSPGDVGELLVRGPYTLRGYYKADDYNRTAFTSHGYLRTGDLVRISARGDMIVEGRIKDVINRGGEKIPAGELEQQLEAHPDIKEAAVIAVPDPVLVERTCAFITTGPQVPSPPEIRDFLRRAGLAEFKLPDRVEVIDVLPRTSLGKVNKVILRERIAAMAVGPAADAKTPLHTKSP